VPDEIAALIPLCNDAVGLVLMISADRCAPSRPKHESERLRSGGRPSFAMTLASESVSITAEHAESSL
jgi:hypothetical protein